MWGEPCRVRLRARDNVRATNREVVAVFLKVCGITRMEDALHAVEHGATALGFVFWPRSPRRWNWSAARMAAANSMPHGGRMPSAPASSDWIQPYLRASRPSAFPDSSTASCRLTRRAR